MKSYTDIEQSKRLAEILPIESADMSYKHFVPEFEPEGYCISLDAVEYDDDIPCWSLAALLEVLPKQLEDGYWWLQIDYIHHAVSYLGRNESVLHYILLNNKPLIDACVEMILNLYKVGYLKVEDKE